MTARPLRTRVRQFFFSSGCCWALVLSVFHGGLSCCRALFRSQRSRVGWTARHRNPERDVLPFRSTRPRHPSRQPVRFSSFTTRVGWRGSVLRPLWVSHYRHSGGHARVREL